MRIIANSLVIGRPRHQSPHPSIASEKQLSPTKTIQHEHVGLMQRL